MNAYDPLSGVVVLATAFLVLLQYGETRLTGLVNEKRRWARGTNIATAVRDRHPQALPIWLRLVNFQPHEARATTVFMFAILVAAAALLAIATISVTWTRVATYLNPLLYACVPFLSLIFFIGVLWSTRDLLQLFHQRSEFLGLVEDLEAIVEPARP